MRVHEDQIRWQRFPQACRTGEVKQWLEIQHMLGLAPNTIEAYGRGLEDFLRWCKRTKTGAVAASRAEIAAYVGDLRKRPGPRGKGVIALDSGSGLSNATMQQRLTAIRLFFDYLIEEGRRDTNPVGRGRYTPGKGFGGGKRERGLLPRHKRLPWIPTDEEWRRLLEHARQDGVRNRCMLALAYDAALRREELCRLVRRTFSRPIGCSVFAQKRARADRTASCRTRKRRASCYRHISRIVAISRASEVHSFCQSRIAIMQSP